MNYRVSAMAALAMNLLRLLGRHTLLAPQSPVLHAAQRRSIRTVMQKLMIKAVRHDVPRPPVVRQNGPAFAVFAQHWRQLGTV